MGSRPMGNRPLVHRDGHYAPHKKIIGQRMLYLPLMDMHQRLLAIPGSSDEVDLRMSHPEGRSHFRSHCAGKLASDYAARLCASSACNTFWCSDTTEATRPLTSPTRP